MFVSPSTSLVLWLGPWMILFMVFALVTAGWIWVVKTMMMAVYPRVRGQDLWTLNTWGWLYGGIALFSVLGTLGGMLYVDRSFPVVLDFLRKSID